MLISDFTSAIGNPAKSFLWNIIIPAMPNVTGILAQSAQIPGVGSTDIDLYHQGQLAKFSGTVEYEHTWTALIAESESGLIYNSLYEWRQLVFNQADGIGGEPAIYKRSIIIQALTSANTPWLEIELKNAYPKNVDTIELDKSASTESVKISTQFNFDRWEKI